MLEWVLGKKLKKKKKTNQILNLTKIFVTLLLNVNQNDNPPKTCK